MNLTTSVGFELEFSGSNLDRVERELRSKGIDCHNYGRWRHSDGDLWDLKTDSSCGFEAVSPILQTYEELVDAAGVGALIANVGGTATERCGLHVHIGGGDFSSLQLENVFRFFTRYEFAFFLMVPPARRTNIYCKRLSPATINSIKRASFQRNDWWIHTWTDKNVWLNGRRWPDIRTLEFRIMPGSLSPYFIIGYVTFLQCVINTVKDRTINWGMARSKDDRSLFQTMLGQSGFYGPWISEDLKELYLTGRKWAIERYKLANELVSGFFEMTRVVPKIPSVDCRPSWDRGDTSLPQRTRRVRRRVPEVEVRSPASSPPPPSTAYSPIQQPQFISSTPVVTSFATQTTQTMPEISISNATTTSGDWIVSWGQGGTSHLNMGQASSSAETTPTAERSETTATPPTPSSESTPSESQGS